MRPASSWTRRKRDWCLRRGAMGARDRTESYRWLAAHYDRLMSHVDYGAWVSYALKRLELAPAAEEPGEGREPPLILDLACGTGTFAVELARRGFRVIGLDASEEMLAVADAKARQAGVDVFFTCQDLTAFELAEEADAAVCFFDSLNYLTRVEELEQALACTARALRPGAPFLFDLHTEDRLREYGASTFGDSGEDVAYLWESEYDEERRLCTMYLTLFVREADGRYARFDEVHEQLAHAGPEVTRALERAGFQLEGVLGELTEEKPRPGEGRVFYLARRR